MDELATFFLNHIDVVFFFYGLAFFTMGLAVWLESRRASAIRLAGAMVYLAGFGLIHGLHEWFDMFIRLGKFDDLTPTQLLVFNGVRLGELVLSFALLVVFGVLLIFSERWHGGRERPLAWLTAGGLVILWLVSVGLTRLIYAPPNADLVLAADGLARYIVGIPGAILATWAIVLEQRAFQARGMPDFGRSLLWAGVALALYGLIGQLFVTPSFLFPANVVNADLFLRLTGFPVQLFRAALAAVMAVFVIRALRAFEFESRQRLKTAEDAARRETEQRHREMQTAVQELSLLYDLSRSLAATIDRATLLQTTTAHVFERLPRIGGGMILVRERAGRPLEIIARASFPAPETSYLSPLECSFTQAMLLGEHIANTGRLAWCDGVQVIDLGAASDILADASLSGDAPSFALDVAGYTIGVPLFLQEQVAGSVVLSVRPDAPPFAKRDLALIITVAGQLGIALENANLYQAVQEREALRGELYRQVVTARERERQRLARELHDSAAQTLTALGLGLAAVAENLSTHPERVSAQLHELRPLSSQALQEIHDLIADLRPSLLDNLGLVTALRSQTQAFEKRTAITATFAVRGPRRRLAPEVEMTVFRIAQEALNNVARHAQANRVAVRLVFGVEVVCVRVRDNGRGFDTAVALDTRLKERQTWGLLGMQERVALVGGSFLIRSRPGAGTMVQACIPLVVGE